MVTILYRCLELESYLENFLIVIVFILFCYYESGEEILEDVDMEEEKESGDDSDEEHDFTENTQDANDTDLGEDIIHQLSKSEEKELRKFRKVDYSWITVL